MKTKKDTVLIVTKHPDSKGGVVSYYKNFFKAFDDEQFDLEWFTIGSRPWSYEKRLNRKASYLLETILDVLRFIFLLLTRADIKLVQVNPSFIPIPLGRDAIYVDLARLFRKKTISFFRGWSKQYEAKVLSSSRLQKKILKNYSKVNYSFVLAEKFKKVLVDIGIDGNKIEVTRTMFDKKNIVTRQGLKKSTEDLNFIYLGRLSEPKGVFDLVEALKILYNKGKKVNMNLYGHYTTPEFEKQLKSKNLDELKGVNFMGYVDGLDKFEALAQADVFVFPSHNEGCPNALIEAMASGLYCICTPVGAMDELILDKHSGRIIPINNPKEMANELLWCLENSNVIRQKGPINANIAFKDLEQTVVISRFKTIYTSLVYSTN